MFFLFSFEGLLAFRIACRFLPIFLLSALLSALICSWTSYFYCIATFWHFVLDHRFIFFTTKTAYRLGSTLPKKWIREGWLSARKLERSVIGVFLATTFSVCYIHLAAYRKLALRYPIYLKPVCTISTADSQINSKFQQIASHFLAFISP